MQDDGAGASCGEAGFDDVDVLEGGMGSAHEGEDVFRGVEGVAAPDLLLAGRGGEADVVGQHHLRDEHADGHLAHSGIVWRYGAGMPRFVVDTGACTRGCIEEALRMGWGVGA